MVSGSVSLPSRGSFHLSLTVLVRYRSVASVQPWRVGPPDSDGVSRVPPYLGYLLGQRGLRARGCHPLRRDFPDARARALRLLCRSRNPRGLAPGFGHWSAFARRYLRNRYFFLFLRLLRCFTSPGLAPAALFGSRGGGILEDAGLPHSETPGSKTACVSPGLIAACRVLLRLPPPRHPPCARTVWTPNSRAPVGPHGPRGRRNGRRRGHVLEGRAQNTRAARLV